MNSSQLGNIGVGRAIDYFTSLGYVVSIPLTDSQDYDIIVDDGNIQRIQVKYCAVKRDDKRVKYRRRSGSKKRAIKKDEDVKCDYVFVAGIDGIDWLIPRHIMHDRMYLNENGKAAQYIVRRVKIEII